MSATRLLFGVDSAVYYPYHFMFAYIFLRLYTAWRRGISSCSTLSVVEVEVTGGPVGVNRGCSGA
jgi:hypothetical protein